MWRIWWSSISTAFSRCFLIPQGPLLKWVMTFSRAGVLLWTVPFMVLNYCPRHRDVKSSMGKTPLLASYICVKNSLQFCEGGKEYIIPWQMNWPCFKKRNGKAITNHWQGVCVNSHVCFFVYACILMHTHTQFSFKCSQLCKADTAIILSKTDSEDLITSMVGAGTWTQLVCLLVQCSLHYTMFLPLPCHFPKLWECFPCPSYRAEVTLTLPVLLTCLWL